MKIPKHYKQFCKSDADIIECPYLLYKSCPATCGYARNISGVGAMVHVPEGLEKKCKYLGRGCNIAKFSKDNCKDPENCETFKYFEQNKNGLED